MVTLDKTLDQIMKLDYASREMLLEILRKRVIEEKRKGFSVNAKKAKSAFLKGSIKAKSPTQVLAELNSL